MDELNTLIGQVPVPVLVVAAIVVLFSLGRVLSGRLKRKPDTRRMFTSAERKTGFARAENRCELDGFLWFRCSSEAEHGDHFFPWSRGGATSMQNFVAACASCNMSKGARLPSGGHRRRIGRRRKKYFPVTLPAVPGEWFAARR